MAIKEPRCLVAGEGSKMCKKCCANCKDMACVRRCKNSPDKCGVVLLPKEEVYKTPEEKREANRLRLKEWREKQKRKAESV